MPSIVSGLGECGICDILISIWKHHSGQNAVVESVSRAMSAMATVALIAIAAILPRLMSTIDPILCFAQREWRTQHNPELIVCVLDAINEVMMSNVDNADLALGPIFHISKEHENSHVSLQYRGSIDRIETRTCFSIW